MKGIIQSDTDKLNRSEQLIKFVFIISSSYAECMWMPGFPSVFILTVFCYMHVCLIHVRLYVTTSCGSTELNEIEYLKCNAIAKRIVRIICSLTIIGCLYKTNQAKQLKQFQVLQAWNSFVNKKLYCASSKFILIVCRV